MEKVREIRAFLMQVNVTRIVARTKTDKPWITLVHDCYARQRARRVLDAVRRGNDDMTSSRFKNATSGLLVLSAGAEGPQCTRE
jgi:hypothetical protein